jgi:hypothetical protein
MVNQGLHANQRNRLDWVRTNILQHLSRVDRVIAEMIPGSGDLPGVRGDEPWVELLFERRQGLQTTLCEVEQQLAERRI